MAFARLNSNRVYQRSRRNPAAADKKQGGNEKWLKN